MKTLFLQASANDFQRYAGPVGLMLSIVTGGFVCAIWIIYKILRDQLKEKDKIIEKLERKIDACQEEINRLRDFTIDRMNDSLDRTNKIMEDTSIAFHENSSVIKHVEGVLMGMQK